MFLNDDFAAEGKARVDPKVLRGLMRKSDRAGFLQLASHLLAIAASGTGLWMTWGSWWAVPSFIVHGILVNWLYAAQHEMCHDTVFRSRRISEWFGRFTGFVLLFPRDYDRWQHFCHHRHTQDPARDSELVYQSLFKGRFGAWLSLSGISLWLGLLGTMVQHAVTGRRRVISEYYLTQNMERRVVAEARWHLALYGLIAAVSVWFGTWAAVILWWAPMLVMSWTHQIQNIIEHDGMPFISDTWRNTRTVRTNPIMRWPGLADGLSHRPPHLPGSPLPPSSPNSTRRSSRPAVRNPRPPATSSSLQGPSPNRSRANPTRSRHRPGTGPVCIRSGSDHVPDLVDQTRIR